MQRSTLIAAFCLPFILVGCGGGGGGGSTPPVTVTSSAVATSSSSSSLSSSSSSVSSSSSSTASGLAFCANLTSDPDGDGVGLENNQSCQMRTGFDITAEMGVGWNLGNTMDATGNTSNPLGDETYWGNPKTTKANMDALKTAGFNTLRLPVSWDDHFTGTDYAIDKAWMDRVEEIAKYALDNNMYVIVNIHHNGWVAPSLANEANSKDHLVKLWKQIAERFKSYDHHVIFETMNEPRVAVNGVDDWSGKQEYFDVVNRLNVAALDAIRKTGGNNEKRLVMLPGYVAGSSSLQLNAVVMPNDKMIALSTHAYSPYSFALDQKGTDKFTDTKTLDDMYSLMNTKFILNGIPVIMGEWASTDKGNLAERIKHAEYYIKGAKKYGIPTVWWDNGNFSKPTDPNASDIMGMLDRKTNTWAFPTLLDAIIKNAK